MHPTESQILIGKLQRQTKELSESFEYKCNEIHFFKKVLKKNNIDEKYTPKHRDRRNQGE